MTDHYKTKNQMIDELRDLRKLVDFYKLEKELVDQQHKQVEKQLLQLLRKWLESNTLSSNILEYSSEFAITATDLDFRIIFYNKKAEELHGYTAEETIGCNLQEMHTKVKAEPEFFQQAVDIVLKEGKYEYETIKENMAGEKTILLSVLFPMLDKQGKHCGYVIYSHDITNDRLLENEKKLRETQFQRTLRMKSVGRLAGGIAHNFNNILNSAMGYASLIKSQIDVDNEFFEDIGLIENSVRQASKLTKRLLDFTEGGESCVESLECSSIVTSVLKLLGSSLKDKIKVEYKYDGGEFLILGDRRQIQQTIMNICHNALEAMPDGGKLQISINIIELDKPYALSGWMIAPGKYVVLQISDTGIGMTEDTLGHIFEPFYTTKETWEGAGLGLSTTYGIMKDHLGYIDVQSKPECGSTITLYFPAINAYHKRSENLFTSHVEVSL